MRDPFEVLGVSPTDGPAVWKRAYRRLAMRWHPDRSDDPAATERFKEINAAYERIVASELLAETENPADEDAREADGEAGSEAASPRAADIRRNLELSLEEAANGTRKTISYHRARACSTCDGSGQAGLKRTRFCAACHGSGRVSRGGGGLQACVDCGGRGLFSEQICPDCDGAGRISHELSLEISVPPGMLSGDELRLAGQGEMGGTCGWNAGGKAGSEGLADGDLYLTLVLRSHRVFELRGRDLLCRLPVSALALWAGAVIEVPTLAGRVPLTLTPGEPARREVRVPGRGYPGRGSAPPGDLHVVLEPVWPVGLDKAQRELLLGLERSLQAERSRYLPEIDAWWADNTPDAGR